MSQSRREDGGPSGKIPVVAEARTSGEPTGVVTAEAEPAAGAPRVRERRGTGRGRIAMAIAGVLVLALVLRLGYVALTPGYAIVHDARDYDHHAVSIAAGDGYALLGPGPTRETARLYGRFRGGC